MFLCTITFNACWNLNVFCDIDVFTFAFVCIKLPATFYDSVQYISACSMAIFTAGFASPYVLLLIIPCAAGFIWTAKVFVGSARDLKRLDGLTRSPIFALFSTIYGDLATIRAFKKTNMMIEKGLGMIDVNSRMSIMFEAISRWLALTLEFITGLLITSTAILCVYLAYTFNLDSNAVGLVLSYMISLSGILQWCVRQTADTENYMTSTGMYILCSHKILHTDIGKTLQH